MFTGFKKGKRVLFADPKVASTLRNKGFSGINRGEKLSVDMITAYFLFSKKKANVYDQGRMLEDNDFINILGKELYKYYAYKFLRERGYKPAVKNNSLYLKNKRVLVTKYPEIIAFNTIRNLNNLLVVVDDEGECILYELERIRLPNHLLNTKGPDNRKGDFNYLVKSGSKYGSDFRIYEKNSTHAKYLMSIGDYISTRDLVARVRVAHSVKKIYIQALQKPSNKYFGIKWISV